MADASDLYGACVNLLATTAAILATTAEGAPTVVEVYPGPPALDCIPMLAVYWSPIVRPTTAPQSAALDSMHRMRAWMNIVTFNVLVVRCAPLSTDDGEPPSVVEVNTRAKAVADDAWALNCLLPRRIIDGSLFGNYPCRETAMGPVVQMTASGGAVGCTVQIQAELDGYGG